MGGDTAAAAKLQTFMASLNATRNVPEDWSGNEPDEWAPWEFDFFGAPDETQRFVRAIADSEYADAPVDEPGNDDLGALSSWYVWAAIGLFPVTPGAANLSLASPLFPSVTITLPNGRRLVERAPGATASRPYVHTLSVSGITRPLPAPVRPAAARPRPTPLAGIGIFPGCPPPRSARAGPCTTRSRAPPTHPGALLPAPPRPPTGPVSSRPWVLAVPSGATTLTAGQPESITLGLAPAGSAGATVHWQAAPVPGGVTVTPSSGTLTVPGACRPTTLVRADRVTVAAPVAGTTSLRVNLSTAGGVTLPPVVVDLQVQG